MAEAEGEMGGRQGSRETSEDMELREFDGHLDLVEDSRQIRHG